MNVDIKESANNQIDEMNDTANMNDKPTTEKRCSGRLAKKNNNENFIKNIIKNRYKKYYPNEVTIKTYKKNNNKKNTKKKSVKESVNTSNSTKAVVKPSSKSNLKSNKGNSLNNTINSDEKSIKYKSKGNNSKGRSYSNKKGTKNLFNNSLFTPFNPEMSFMMENYDQSIASANPSFVNEGSFLFNNSNNLASNIANPTQPNNFLEIKERSINSITNINNNYNINISSEVLPFLSNVNVNQTANNINSNNSNINNSYINNRVASVNNSRYSDYEMLKNLLKKSSNNDKMEDQIISNYNNNGVMRKSNAENNRKESRISKDSNKISASSSKMKMNAQNKSSFNDTNEEENEDEEIEEEEEEEEDEENEDEEVEEEEENEDEELEEEEDENSNEYSNCQSGNKTYSSRLDRTISMETSQTQSKHINSSSKSPNNSNNVVKKNRKLFTFETKIKHHGDRNDYDKFKEPLSLSKIKKLEKSKRRSRHEKVGRVYKCECGKSYLSDTALNNHKIVKHNYQSEKRGKGRPKKLDYTGGFAGISFDKYNSVFFSNPIRIKSPFSLVKVLHKDPSVLKKFTEIMENKNKDKENKEGTKNEEAMKKGYINKIEKVEIIINNITNSKTESPDKTKEIDQSKNNEEKEKEKTCSYDINSSKQPNIEESKENSNESSLKENKESAEISVKPKHNFEIRKDHNNNLNSNFNSITKLKINAAPTIPVAPVPEKEDLSKYIDFISEYNLNTFSKSQLTRIWLSTLFNKIYKKLKNIIFDECIDFESTRIYINLLSLISLSNYNNDLIQAIVSFSSDSDNLCSNNKDSNVTLDNNNKESKNNNINSIDRIAPFSNINPINTISSANMFNEYDNINTMNINNNNNKANPSNSEKHTIDDCFIKYIIFLSKNSNVEYFNFGLLYVLLFREYLNKYPPSTNSNNTNSNNNENTSFVNKLNINNTTNNFGIFNNTHIDINKDIKNPASLSTIPSSIANLNNIPSMSNINEINSISNITNIPINPPTNRRSSFVKFNADNNNYNFNMNMNMGPNIDLGNDPGLFSMNNNNGFDLNNDAFFSFGGVNYPFDDIDTRKSRRSSLIIDLKDIKDYNKEYNNLGGANTNVANNNNINNNTNSNEFSYLRKRDSINLGNGNFLFNNIRRNSFLNYSNLMNNNVSSSTGIVNRKTTIATINEYTDIKKKDEKDKDQTKKEEVNKLTKQNAEKNDRFKSYGRSRRATGTNFEINPFLKLHEVTVEGAMYLEYTANINNSSNDLPLVFEKFISEYLEPKDYFNIDDPEEIVQITQHFSYWLNVNGYSTYRVILV